MYAKSVLKGLGEGDDVSSTTKRARSHESQFGALMAIKRTTSTDSFVATTEELLPKKKKNRQTVDGATLAMNQREPPPTSDFVHPSERGIYAYEL